MRRFLILMGTLALFGVGIVAYLRRRAPVSVEWEPAPEPYSSAESSSGEAATLVGPAPAFVRPEEEEAAVSEAAEEAEDAPSGDAAEQPPADAVADDAVEAGSEATDSGS